MYIFSFLRNLSIPTDTPCWIDVNSMAILRRYVEEKTSTKFNVISMYFLRSNFNGSKINVVPTYFVSFNFSEQEIDVVLTYFLRRNFDRRKIDVISMCFVQRDFKSTTFPPNFDGQKNWRCFHVYFYVILILICFWMTRNSCRFDIYFWKCFDIPKTKAVWNSLLDVISFRFDFFKIILSHLEMY